MADQKPSPDGRNLQKRNIDGNPESDLSPQAGGPGAVRSGKTLYIGSIQNKVKFTGRTSVKSLNAGGTDSDRDDAANLTERDDA